MPESPKPRAEVLLWASALLIGFVLRAVPLTAARPYIAYVDEGNFLHPAFRLVREGGWDSHFYLYPQFPTSVVTAAARVLNPLYRAIRGVSLRERIPARVELYDDLEPFALLFMARCLSLGLGLAIIVLTGLLARRLAGPRAGAAAALLAAVTPALVLRGSIAMVDPFATFCVLACVLLADVARTARRPGWISLLSGAMAGAAFASKYPAVLVVVAAGVTILSEELPLREKARRLLLGAGGLAVGATLAMPVLLVHPGAVVQALRFQNAAYAQFVSPPLWRQALVRAEMDLPYEGPELGLGLVALALGGIVVALRDRRARPAAAGWCAFAAASLLFYGYRPFQPFRNLLPLVPLVCASASLFFLSVRRSLRSPRFADALGMVWILAVFVVPLWRYAAARHTLVDSRTAAIDWLAARTRPEDRVLVVKEPGFLNQELARLHAATTAVWWDQAEVEITALQPRFVLAGVLSRGDGSSVDASAAPAIAAHYAVAFEVGGKSTAPYREWWRGNDQIVYVLDRKDPSGN